MGELSDAGTTRVILACRDCGVHWQLGAEQPQCADSRHRHQRLEVHVHRSVVGLPDGTELTAASFDAGDPYARDRPPDYGLYLDHRWQPPWIHERLDWPDFGVPDDVAHVISALAAVLDRARRGQGVEIGCLGGHGRTGTALACLAVLAGHPAREAVAWVRTNYCSAAVETADQELWSPDSTTEPLADALFVRVATPRRSR